MPAPTVAINPAPGATERYKYQYNDLTGAGDVFIPIIDPSALVLSSLPSNVTIISDLATIEADWPGAGNFIPADEPAFVFPAELLEVQENGSYSLDFSFLDKALPVDGPILADGTLITDPPVPGSSPVPEPKTWLMMLRSIVPRLLSTAKTRGNRVWIGMMEGSIRMAIGTLIFKASLSAVAFCTMSARCRRRHRTLCTTSMPDRANSRGYGRSLIAHPIVPLETLEAMARGTVTIKFVPQKNCGNAQEPTNEVWYVSPAGFKGVDTLTFPFGARSKEVLNVTVN